MGTILTSRGPDTAMPRRKPSHSPTGNLRRAIASRAARIMAEDGIDDYGLAKRKAARALGAGESEALPTNQEIEAELRAYQSIYQEEELPARLKLLRETALDVMTALADFRPYLTGPVLEGTAGRYAEVEIELFADSGKDVEIMLLSSDIPYEIADNSRHFPEGPEAQLRLDWDGVPVLLSVFPLVAERQRLRNPHTGRSRSRANAKAVAGML
jgi:hypothetical protein